MKYKIEFNNNEVEILKEFDTYEEAFNYATELMGQWVVAICYEKESKLWNS